MMLLPGPPHELKSMFERECLPRLKRLAPPQAIRTVVLRVAGMSESDLDQLISPVYGKYQNPVTTILAANAKFRSILRPAAPPKPRPAPFWRRWPPPSSKLLGDRVYSRNGDPLEVVVGNLLRDRRATVSVAESCTGGMLGERLTSVSGSSDYFVGGFITYSNAMKVSCWASLRGPGGARRREPADRRSHGHGRAPPHRLHLRAFHYRGGGFPMAKRS